MNGIDRARMRRLRGVVLKLLRLNQKDRKPRLDDITIWGVLSDLKHRDSINEVRTVLNDLHDRNCISYDEDRDDHTGEVSYRKIRIDPRGVDLVEGVEQDPAVEVVG